MVNPPPLPPRLSDMPTIVGLGSLLWAVAAVALLAAGVTGLALTTSVSGAVLGGIGYAVFRWQRAAARRGSRGAQQGLDGASATAASRCAPWCGTRNDHRPRHPRPTLPP